ncbi:hypothetical protein D0T49_12845 [Paludibacter sp. 221]|uniref:hypothetical protein n=1 Tax=Paludibacter sp. 221 TaxID=2302939 RepID=UPI0013D572B4|nr:hypothetical protein [Paludibacter sp. 221]NDV47932.1 hypothetical protein [Paludibacter sp. 221]
MGHLLQKKNGAVFFVDILGFAALTQNKIDLDDKDYAAWNIPGHLGKHDNQLLAATILVEFRKILLDFQASFPSVTIAQLSDCAFVWSENIRDVIIVACNLMRKCVKEGILCRGGLSCGEIIETSQNNNIGRLILGEAVSNAARLEQCGAKGMRIMMNDEVPRALHDYDEKFYNRMEVLFQPFENPLDYKIYDELKWYYIPDMNENMPELRNVDKNYMIDATCERIKLAGHLRLHPKFSWNAKNSEGQNQLISSIRFIAANEKTIFNIHHWFDWSNLVEKRSDATFKKMIARVDRESQQAMLHEKTIYFPEPE